MNGFRVALFFCALAVSGAALAQKTVRVRGVITAFDGNVLSVKSREGRDVKIELAAGVSFAYMKALKLADITPGTALGTTVVRDRDGRLVAREIHVLRAAGGAAPNEGMRPSDLEPDSSMLNAVVSAVVQATDGRALTLGYTGSSHQVMVPEAAPIVTAVAAGRSVLVPGEYAFIAATVGADGKITASRVQVSKDGVKPPQ